MSKPGLAHVYIDGIPPMMPHIQSGRLRVLAVSSAQRLPNFPAIPAVAETLPGFVFDGWFTLIAPVGTPQAVIKKIARDADQALKTPELSQRLAGLDVCMSTP